MKVDIHNGDLVGSAEWRGPGQVAVDMPDEATQAWFEDYFESEDATLSGPVECAEIHSGRRDASEESFQRAAFRLAAYAYTVKARNSARAVRDDGGPAAR